MGAVRIFVRSLMSGAFGSPCDAAWGDIAVLGDELAQAENYPVSPISAHVACLAGVPAAEAVELIWGSQYGCTRAEHNRDPQAGDSWLSRSRDRIEAALFPPTGKRAALLRDAEHLAEGLAVRLVADDARRTPCLSGTRSLSQRVLRSDAPLCCVAHAGLSDIAKCHESHRHCRQRSLNRSRSNSV